MILVYRYRVKNLTGELNRQARAVNVVWNFCNDVQKQALKWSRKWPSGYDFCKLTSGSSKEMGLHSATITEVCQQYDRSRSHLRRPYLRWRGKKSPGWIPLKGRTLIRHTDGFRHNGTVYKVFQSRLLPPGKICGGSNFSQDARGNWFLNIAVECDPVPVRTCKKAVGIDLGLKVLGTLSCGESIEAPKFFRKIETRLGIAQRAKKRRLVRSVYGRIANARHDFLHKLSARLVRDFDYIAIGNVNARAKGKTMMAKSVFDAGWSSFRRMVAYKAVKHGATYEEVNENYSTQTCSECGSISGPKGRKGLVVREWTCGDCGTTHDRDVNAARNILLRSGHRAHVDGAATTGGDAKVMPTTNTQLGTSHG